jgi:hypothetical protein
MGRDVLSGDVFVLLGKDLSKIKLLVWEALALCCIINGWKPHVSLAPNGSREYHL